MNKKSFILLAGIILLSGLVYSVTRVKDKSIEKTSAISEIKRTYGGDTIQPNNKIVKTKEQWKTELTSEQYHVLREKGTERPFTGLYWDNHDEGVFECSGCGNPLFLSDTKFKSGTGWPSYYQPATDSSVTEIKDTSHGMTRVEVVCAKCEGHLGHIFNDGPAPTGLRYCINSASLKLEKPEEE